MFSFLSVSMECPSASVSQRLRTTLYKDKAVLAHGALSINSLKQFQSPKAMLKFPAISEKKGLIVCKMSRDAHHKSGAWI